MERLTLLVAVVLVAVCAVSAQVTFPRVKVKQTGCQEAQIKSCRLDCPAQYHDTERYLCPCYSKMGQCLVQIGCSMRQKRDVFAFCTHKGYCKDGYCTFRAGDLTPRGDVRPEVFELASVKAPGTLCIDNCCPGQTGGDPRLGVNQDYDRMPYSVPLANLP